MVWNVDLRKRGANRSEQWSEQYGAETPERDKRSRIVRIVERNNFMTSQVNRNARNVQLHKERISQIF